MRRRGVSVWRSKTASFGRSAAEASSNARLNVTGVTCAAFAKLSLRGNAGPRPLAIYHLQAKVIQRSKGRSVVAAAAYRAAEALHDAELGRTHDLPDAVLWSRRRHAELAAHFRDSLKAKRRRHAVMVPGLSSKALAAIETLKQAGADSRLIEQIGVLEATEATRAARVAPVWSAIQADILLCLELEPFRQAAAERLKDRLDALGDQDRLRVFGLADTLDRADRLADRHAAMEAARAAERQVEAQRRNKARAAEEARQQAAEKAEVEGKLRELQLGPRPKPSPGPSMG
jgi:hypothetical protein